MYKDKLIELIESCNDENFCKFVFAFANKLKKEWGC